VLDAVVSGLVAGYAVAVPVGAIGVLVLSLAARTRLAVGVAGALGVATTDGLYALVAVLGGGALAGTVAAVAGPARLLAGAVLVAVALWTGTQAWRRRHRPVPARGVPGGTTPVRAFAGLLGLTMINPATVVSFAAVVLGRQSARPFGVAEAAGFVLAAFLASASWQVLLAAGGRLLGQLVGGPRGRLAAALAGSAVILVLALRLATAG